MPACWGYLQAHVLNPVQTRGLASLSTLPQMWVLCVLQRCYVWTRINNEQAIFGLIRLASRAHVAINVDSSRVWCVAIKGMVHTTIPRVLWRLAGRLNSFVRGFVNSPFPHPCGILFIELSTSEFGPFHQCSFNHHL